MPKPSSKNSLDPVFLVTVSVDVYDLRNRFNCLLENGWSCVEKQDEITAVSCPYLGMALPNVVHVLISRSSPRLVKVNEGAHSMALGGGNEQQRPPPPSVTAKVPSCKGSLEHQAPAETPCVLTCFNNDPTQHVTGKNSCRFFL